MLHTGRLVKAAPDDALQRAWGLEITPAAKQLFARQQLLLTPLQTLLTSTT